MPYPPLPLPTLPPSPCRPSFDFVSLRPLIHFGLFGTGHLDGLADVRQDLHGRIDAGREGGEGALQMASRTRDEEC